MAQSRKFVLILVGIPGSGKSTFASALVRVSVVMPFSYILFIGFSITLGSFSKRAPWKYERVNQDTLGNRRECEDLTRKILRKKKIPIIDRCNFNPQQRQYWIDIARSVRASYECIVFSYTVEVCIRRCQQRTNHETISARNAAAVVRRMAREFEPPVPLHGANNNARCRNGEFFHRIQYVSSFEMSDDLVEEYLDR